MKKYVVVWIQDKPFYNFVTGERYKKFPDKYKLTSEWNGDPKYLYICSYRYV